MKTNHYSIGQLLSHFRVGGSHSGVYATGGKLESVARLSGVARLVMNYVIKLLLL